MKLEIEQTNNGFIVTYDEDRSINIGVYVYRSVDDLKMMEDVSKRFLKRSVRIEEK